MCGTMGSWGTNESPVPRRPWRNMTILESKYEIKRALESGNSSVAELVVVWDAKGETFQLQRASDGHAPWGSEGSARSDCSRCTGVAALHETRPIMHVSCREYIAIATFDGPSSLTARFGVTACKVGATGRGAGRVVLSRKARMTTGNIVAAALMEMNNNDIDDVVFH
ncbi:uncharacterized protein EDB91DRAFT_1166583 [Suillus paluster]|uniref:uncharacterized protein n=1 Tax=Suillus paluster TaxID=48578 RepID=UPI001B85E927|nr:uncharacterized protein EDB91DRAFT_1166583 [Suillus paluster]KAG1726178.1 hypothetical protein EDB91DRAFT_1166583 [Suillus paluster]